MKPLHIYVNHEERSVNSNRSATPRSYAKRKLSDVLAKEVEAVYASNWKRWRQSPLCFLEESEADLVGLYFLEGSIEAAAIKSSLTANYAQNRLSRILKKMHRYRITILDWLDAKNKKERMMIVRLASIQTIGILSLRTRNAVSAVADNLDELWIWYQKENKEARGIGKKAQIELKEVFKYAGYIKCKKNDLFS
jgi:hypothetical protein